MAVQPKYQQTDNASVRAEIYPVTSRIAGIVTEVTASDNQTIASGVPLVKLDPRDYQLALTQLRASLEFAKQQATAAEQNLNSAAPPVNIPEPTLPSPGNLAAQPAQRDNFLQAQSTFKQQRDINQQQLKTAQANIAQRQAEVKQAELLISYTNVNALVPGKVVNRNVQVGQRVLPGQILMEIVQPNPWIVAN
ncbi:MAG: biotin/lipoyl-binding protein, partial [Calothrix sp. SM1_7_51]|nr:biotin/lipoyl-binding protein [Calothrix sp. SM1_7_51]